MRAEPNFDLVAELASTQGMQLLSDVDSDLCSAERLIASAAKKLEPLVGPAAAQGLVLAKDARSHLLLLQNKLRALRQSVERLKQDGSPRVAEDAILQQLVQDGSR